jgi:hypothetical protein
MIVPSYDEKAIARFWSYVDRRGKDECWPWKRATPGAGYGEFSAGGVRVKAHRAAVFITQGKIPEGMMVDHICRNRACVNPRHLRVVSPRVNSIENSTSFAAINAAKTHCPQGHLLAGDNLVASAKTRKCRACFRVKQAERNRRYRARKRQGSLFDTEAAA